MTEFLTVIWALKWVLVVGLVLVAAACAAAPAGYQSENEREQV